MLKKLTIENYALIDKTVIDFEEGFTVITGETGAGKSIMLDALTLLMGARADTKAMGNKEKKTIVEAIFTDPDKAIKNICEENGIDWDPNEIILRREISPGGKSRGFVNDTPVTLSILAAISNNLIDIHSQHSNTLLNSPAKQLSIIDFFGENTKDLENYRNTFRQYVSLRNKIKSTKDEISQSNENREFLEFRLEQLEKLKPKTGELALLEKEAEMLGDADHIKSNLREAYEVLGEGSGSALRSMQNATTLLDGIDLSLLDSSDNEDIIERLENLRIELRDIADTIEEYSDKVNSDPQKLEKLQKRIERYYEVMRRFKVRDDEELVKLHQQLKEEQKTLLSAPEDLTEMEARLKELAKVLKTEADALTASRIESSEKFALTLQERIRPLGLPNLIFDVKIEKGKMSADGQDILTFYCSFNKNHKEQPISEIASGGEISRVMLGIKSLMAEKMSLPTIIFDEIDTGVSGEVAHKMGLMMREMSANLQVMAVTHLPQVASAGNEHLKVYKAEENDKTVSHIRKLDLEGRITEIAGMLSGNTINEVAKENARLLLQIEK